MLLKNVKQWQAYKSNIENNISQTETQFFQNKIIIELYQKYFSLIFFLDGGVSEKLFIYVQKMKKYNVAEWTKKTVYFTKF